MKESENSAKLGEIFAKVLSISSSEVSDVTSPENTPSWDSFNALMLVSEIEKEFSIQFGAADVADIRNVSDLKAVMRKRGIDI